MKNTQSRIRQLVAGFAVAGTMLFLTAVVHAQNQTVIDENGFNAGGTVIDDYVLYNVGGGRAVSMTRTPGMKSITVGMGWNSNLICGDMSLSTTLQNQLNGITNGFQNIMSGIIQNATSAVASLPALIIQRANPALYNLLTNGILQARLDYDRSKLTCRAIAEKMADVAGGQLEWDRLSEGMALKAAVNRSDAVSAIEEAEADRGNKGIPWVGGDNAGGAGQEPIRIVGSATSAGYNLLNGRSVTDTSAINSGNCQGNMVCSTWKSPEEARAFAVRVLGEQEQRTCEGCTKTQTTPGVGLTPLIQEEYEEKLQAISELVNGSKPTNAENLTLASSNSLPVTRGVIEALREEPDLELMANRLASEVALASVMEKALLLQRTMLTGSKEPNIAANELAQNAIFKETSVLEQEINNLKTELELRRTLAGNSASAILERHRIRSESSRGIYEGDPQRNRLDDLQRTMTP
ncbi:MAG: hypothetical protein BACD_02590 [Bacteroides rodentium]